MKRIIIAALVVCGAVWSSGAAAQYPDKPVRILVPYAPGGIVDIAARLVGKQLSLAWHQSVIVENRPGGNGFIAVTDVARADPDGYTLLMAHTGEFAVNPAIFRKIPYNLDRDFVPISLVSDTPLSLATIASSPLKTVQDIIDQSRKAPGSLTYATPGTGSYNQLTGEWFASTAHIKLTHVPYKGGAPAATAVASGEVSFGVVATSSVDQFVKSGRVRVIALTTARHIAAHPTWKTLDDAGVHGIDASNWVGLFAPKKTPPAIVQKINHDVVAALQDPQVKAAFAVGDADAVGSTSQEFEARIKRDLARNRIIVKQSGIPIQ